MTINVIGHRKYSCSDPYVTNAQVVVMKGTWLRTQRQR